MRYRQFLRLLEQIAEILLRLAPLLQATAEVLRVRSHRRPRDG
jgi:hypothetical protein